MERVRTIFLWVAFAFLATPDSFALNNTPRSNRFSIFEVDGKVGLKDEDGSVLIPASYDALGWSNGEVTIVDKVIGYKASGLWGLINTSNKVVAEAAYLHLTPAEGSYLIAQKKSPLTLRPSFGVISTSGKIAIPFQYDALKIVNMRAVVMSKNGSRYYFGLVDMSNNVVIPAGYSAIYSLGSLRYAVENFENKTAIFSEEGKQVTEFVIDSISPFRKDYAIVYKNQRQGLIDRNGVLTLAPTFGAVRILDNGTIEAKDVDSWTVLSGDNKTLAQLDAEEILPVSAQRYTVFQGGKAQLTDNSFQPLHDEFVNAIGAFNDGVALFRDASRTGVINTAGSIVIPAQYGELIPDGQHYRARVSAGGRNRWVILDAEGKEKSVRQYEAIAPFNGMFYPVRNRGFWGAVNADGKQIITCVHDSILQVSGDLVAVKFKGQYGVINLRENWVVTPQANTIEVLNGEAYLERSDKTTFLRKLSGRLVYFTDHRLRYVDGILKETLPDGQEWTISMDGVIVNRSTQPVGVETVMAESEGLRAIQRDGKFGFIDGEGRLRIANRYEAVRAFTNGLAAIRIRNKWGFIDRQERLVVQPVYDHVGDYSNGIAIVGQNGQWGIIDASGREILPLRYDQIERNAHGRYVLRQNGLSGLADDRGALRVHPRYDQLLDCGNEFVIARRDKKSGVLTLRGVSTIPMIYDNLTYDAYRDQFLAVRRATWKTVSSR